MKNYIEINNVNSSTIPGLIIQNLPPITKPKMRTQIEEIDGRSGDIITPLGYSAYTKEFTIGLSFGYDVDQIIEYFNTSGIITFSNEEDKYYHFQMIEQIDFEKLLRFKTATIKLHVQPFKYSTTDNSKKFDLSGLSSISIRNVGNIYSRPVLIIEGTGDIGITLNDNQIFSISLEDLGSIIIDTENMEAYQDGTLLNRIVVGDYDNFKLNVGTNTISWSGEVTSITIQNFSRWI